MPNRRTHQIVGAAAGAVSAAVFAEYETDQDRFAVMLGAIIGGYAGGRLPDVLEPALSPNHRQFCHSLTCVWGTCAVAAEGYREARTASLESARQETTPLLRCLRFMLYGAIMGLPAGYASHLVLDGCTPKGLPLLGKLS